MQMMTAAVAVVVVLMELAVVGVDEAAEDS